MDHYIKIEEFHFDHIKKLLSLKFYFDIEEGYSSSLDRKGWYNYLDFESIKIDTEDTFICSNEPSTLATEITPVDAGQVDPHEKYNVIQNGVLVKSVRKTWDLTIDLNDVNLNGVLSATGDLSNKLLFLYVTVSGKYNVTSGTWVDKQPKTVMFALYDYKTLYEIVYSKLASAMDVDCCSCLDMCAANNVVFLNGLEASLRLERWQDAINFWSLLHGESDIATKSCNCN